MFDPHHYWNAFSISRLTHSKLIADGTIFHTKDKEVH